MDVPCLSDPQARILKSLDGRLRGAGFNILDSEVFPADAGIYASQVYARESLANFMLLDDDTLEAALTKRILTDFIAFMECTVHTLDLWNNWRTISTRPDIVANRCLVRLQVSVDEHGSENKHLHTLHVWLHFRVRPDSNRVSLPYNL